MSDKILENLLEDIHSRRLFVIRSFYIYFLCLFLAPLLAQSVAPFQVLNVELCLPDLQLYNNFEGWIGVTGEIATSGTWHSSEVDISGQLLPYRNEVLSQTNTTFALPPFSKKRFFIYLYLYYYPERIRVIVSGQDYESKQDIQLNISYETNIQIGYLIPEQTANYSIAFIKDVQNVVWYRWMNYEYRIGYEIERTGSTLKRIGISRMQKYMLPDRWIGYQFLDVLILNERAEISEDRRKAIEQWLLRGGILMLSPQDPSWLRNDPWIHKMLGKAINPKTHFYQDAPTEIVKIIPKAGKILQCDQPASAKEASGLSNFIWSMGYGGGTIIYCGVDVGNPTYQSTGLWEQHLFPMILQGFVRRHGFIGYDWHNGVNSNLNYTICQKLNLSKRYMPKIGTILLLLVIYLLCVGPLNFAYLHRKQKTIHLVWTIPLCAIFFSIIILTYGYWLRGNQSVGQSVRIIHNMPEANTAFHREYLAFLSGAHDLYTIALKQKEGGLEPIRTSGSSKIIYQQDQSLTIQEHNLNLWEMGYFDTYSMTPALPIQLKCKGNTFQITKKSRMALGKFLVLKDNTCFVLPGMSSNATTQSYRLDDVLWQHSTSLSSDYDILKRKLWSNLGMLENQKEIIDLILQHIQYDPLSHTVLIPILMDPDHEIQDTAAIDPDAEFTHFRILCLDWKEE